MMKMKFYTCLVGIFLMVSVKCFAQQKTAYNELLQSIAVIDSAFNKNSVSDFNKAVPLETIQELYASLVKDSLRRVAGKSKIISLNKDSAYVLLSGLILYGNSGDETNYSNYYTGIYKFERTGGFWKLKSKIKIDRSNQIKKQNLNLTVIPGKGIKVKDTLTININDSFGFAVRLNHRAKVNNLSLNGAQTDFVFSGGLLWVNAKVKKNQRLVIEYTIDVEKDEKDKNSGYFADVFGHIRNQYFWHPFFSFSSPNDRADFTLHCTIPKSYYMTTSLPQKDNIVGDVREIVAKSEMPTFGLAIYYDREWEVNTFKKDQIEMVIYATKDFLPKKEKLYTEFSKNYDTLQKHFGKPISNYFAIAQDRSSPGGWKNRANSVVVAGEIGSILIMDKPNPRAIFGHEVAHGWTSPTGPATNFLMEGWATYAESILLSEVYGDTIVGKFFKFQKQNYINGEHEGNISLWEDYSNSGVSYNKGSWLFYMLANQLGKEKLSLVMQNFVRSRDQTIQSFINQLTKVAGSNMEPSMTPWLKSNQIPALNVQKLGNALKIVQKGDVFIFPLTVGIKLKDGTSINKVLDIKNKEQVFTIGEGEIESYVLDPENKLLFSVK